MAELVKCFSVVEFPCEDGSTEVEVVPYLWLRDDNNKCYWPNVKSSEKLRKLVGSLAVPNENWRTCEVTRVFGTYKTLLEARNKANKAIDTSDINTDNEKRRRQPPKRFNVEQVSKDPNKKTKIIPNESSDSEQSDLDSLPTSPPTLPSFPAALKSNTASFFLNSHQSSSRSRLEYNEPVGSLSQRIDQDPNSRRQWEANIELPVTIQTLVTPDHPTRKLNVTSHSKDVTRTNGVAGFGCEPMFSPQNGSPFERKVSADIFGIKTRLTQIESTMNLILAQLNKLSEPPHRNPLALKLPASTLEELKLLDIELGEQEVQIQMIQFCKTLGGSSAADMTRRILRKIMTDAVASQINWRGHNGKLSFEKTKMSELIIAGVQAFYGPGDTKGNAKIVEQTTKEWLKQAPNRMKQSKQRVGLGQAHPQEGNSSDSSGIE